MKVYRNERGVQRCPGATPQGGPELEPARLGRDPDLPDARFDHAGMLGPLPPGPRLQLHSGGGLPGDR